MQKCSDFILLEKLELDGSDSNSRSTDFDSEIIIFF